MGEQPCMKMGFGQLSMNNMYVSIPGKLLEIHLHAWLFSNPCGKVLIIVGISWSTDLRVQLMPMKIIYVICERTLIQSEGLA